MTKQMNPYLRHAARMGRDGDTMIVHVNPREIGLLKRAGGAGSRNPHTGLLEFRVGGSMGAGDPGQGGGHGGPSGAGGSRSGSTGGGSGGGGGPSAQSLLGGWKGSTVNVPGNAQMRRAKPGDWNGPQPGTNDRWGYNNAANPMAPAVAQQHTDYNAAADNLANRGFGGWLGDRLKGLVPGLHPVTPDARIPSTYAGGIYHDAWSPLSAALGIAGMAAPVPGAGLAAGQLGQQVSDAAHLNEYTFGGGGWGPTTHAAQPGTFDDQNAPQQAGGGFSNTGNGASHLQNLAQINQPVSGNPAAPQPVGAPGTPPAAPAGPNFQQIMANLQQITPGYGVQLPGYQYGRRGATV